MVVITRTIKPSKPQFEIIHSQKQVNLFMAGQGSGKSHVAGVVSAIFIKQYPTLYGFIGANTHLQLSDSTLKRIFTVWKDFFGWTEYDKGMNPDGIYVVDKKPPPHFNTENHHFKSYHGKICFKNGLVIFIGSLENYKAHDGKEFAWALLDETKDTREVAVKEVILGRLRQQGMFLKDGTPWNPLFIFTSPAKVPWINEWFSLDDFAGEIKEKIYSETDFFLKSVDNKFVVISSTYLNERNLPSTYIPNQKLNLPLHLQNMLIFGDPFSSTGGEFYKCFNRNKHVVENKNKQGYPELYNPELPIHVSFDFNVNPYMTCVIWQVDGKKATQIDEICLENPNNTTPAVCKEFVRRYSSHGAGLFVYGDPAGKHEDTRVEKREEKKYNDFSLIESGLKQFHPTKRVENAAPPVVMRGNFINNIFENQYRGIEIIIGSNCKKSIADYNYLKEASDGRKEKEKEENPQTNVSFEKYGHTSDASDYFLCRIFNKEFTDYQRGDKPVNVESGKNIPSKHNY